MGKGGIIKGSLPFLIIAAVCIIAFREVAFLKETLKFDILDGYLPGHYFISECLRNNLFPLWNPYQQLGFPLYADMLNTNYIVDMVIGRLFPYTNITFHILFIIYIIIAGIGTFRLAKDVGVNVRLSLMAGIAYSLSGFITGNAQHIQFIAGAAWLPFSVLYFLRLSRKPELISALLFVVFTCLLITGGYPSFAIILAYGMIPVFLFFLVKNIRVKNKGFASRYLLFGTLVIVLVVVLCSGIIISIRQATPYVERYVQLTYEYAITNPFPPSALISVVAPFVTAVHPEIFPTDISMNNHYFGVIVLILFIYSITNKISKTGILLLSAAALLLLFSFGEHAFLHRIFFEHVPLFNKFRHPSSFRFITILLLLLFTGIQISNFDPAEGRYFKRFRTVYLICISVIASISALSAFYILYKLSGPAVFTAKWENFIHDYGIYGPLFIQTFIFVIINVPFIYLVLYKKRLNLFYPFITAVLIIEVIVFTGMNMRYTVTSQYDPLDIRAFLRNSPAGFPLPDELPAGMHTDESVSHVPLINNTNTYAKSVSADYMYPFVLDGFTKLRSDSNLFREVTSHSVLYFEEPERGDTIICRELTPRQMTFTVKALESRKMVLSQNFFPGWKVSIDGKKTGHYRTLGTLIGISVPKGIHQVTFLYENSLYVKATLGAFGLFILILVIIQVLVFKRRGNGSPWALLYIGLIISGIILCIKPSESFAEQSKEYTQNLQKVIENYPGGSNVLFVLNVETIDPYLNALSGKDFIHTRFRNNEDLKVLWNILDTVNGNRVLYLWNNVSEPPGLRQLISVRFPVIRTLYSDERAEVAEFSKDTVNNTGRNVYRNNYEMPAPFFSEGFDFDSILSFSGLNSEKLSGERLFSSTFRLESDGNSMNVLTMVRFKISGSNSAHLVLSIERAGKSISYDAVDLKAFQTVEPWNTAFIARNFVKSTLKKGDKLVIYCWNSGRNEAVYLDDFYVKIAN